MSTNPTSVLRHSRYCASLTELPPASEEGRRIDAIDQAMEERGVTLLFPVMEKEIRFVTKHRARWAGRVAIHPLAAKEDFEIATDKWALSQLLTDQGIAAPRTWSIDLPAAEGVPLPEVDYPVILKPARGGWGHGIHKFADAAEFSAFVKRYSGPPCRHVVQEFIEGYDIDCSCLCEDGRMLAYTIQRERKANPNPFKPASVVEFIEEPEVRSLVAALMEKLHWGGVAHLDLRYDAQRARFVVIEINGRYWGSLLGSLAYGINFPELACRAALGETFEPPAYSSGLYYTGMERVRGFLRNPVSLFHGRTTLWYTLLDPLPAYFELRRQR
jgi:predicted ATP-grasp superfamily ATP-dependent carboligase